MRLFFAVWPPEEVVRALEALARPELEQLRWVNQWHVTILFLGDAEPGAALDALDQMEVPGGVVAELGPASAVTGRGVLSLPVRGLDQLAAAARDAAEGVPGAEVGRREFRGHLTLARARGRRGRVGPVEPVRLEARWPVRELTLVASTLSSRGPSYEVVGSRALPG